MRNEVVRTYASYRGQRSEVNSLCSLTMSFAVSDKSMILIVLTLNIETIQLLNPCPAEWIKMPYPFLIFSQSDYLIQIVDINLHT